MGERKPTNITMGSFHTHSFLLIPILLVSPPHLTFHIQGVIPVVGLYFGLTLPYPLKTRSYPQKQDWTKKSMSTSWTLPGISSWDSTRQNWPTELAELWTYPLSADATNERTYLPCIVSLYLTPARQRTWHDMKLGGTKLATNFHQLNTQLYPFSWLCRNLGGMPMAGKLAAWRCDNNDSEDLSQSWSWSWKGCWVPTQRKNRS